MVDFGCGDFRLSRPFINQMKELYGVDNWLAPRYHRYSPDDTHFYYGSIEHSPFKSGSFDTVMCTEVLEHVENPEAVVEECFRVLNPSGFLLITIPFNFFIHGAPNDFRRFTIYGLEQLLKKKQFEIVAYTQIGTTFFAVLNQMITFWGYRQSNFIGRMLNLIFVSMLNGLGILGFRLFKRPQILEVTDRELNDRTNPMGYVIIARKRANDQRIEILKNIVVCPHCHSTLEFQPTKIACSKCNTTFKYFEKTPVLSNRESLHLEFDETGEVVDF